MPKAAWLALAKMQHPEPRCAPLPSIRHRGFLAELCLLSCTAWCLCLLASCFFCSFCCATAQLALGRVSKKLHCSQPSAGSAPHAWSSLAGTGQDAAPRTQACTSAKHQAQGLFGGALPPPLHCLVPLLPCTLLFLLFLLCCCPDGPGCSEQKVVLQRARHWCCSPFLKQPSWPWPGCSTQNPPVHLCCRSGTRAFWQSPASSPALLGAFALLPDAFFSLFAVPLPSWPWAE